MNKAILEQLNMLKSLEFQVDGKPSKDFPEIFSEVVFKKNSTEVHDTSMQIFNFADYIIKPFAGFDFHKTFNKNNVTPLKYMRGQVIKETEKMYYIKAKGYSLPTKQCSHCLEPQVLAVDTVCDKCKQELNSNIEDIYWEGWVPKKSCTIMR